MCLFIYTLSQECGHTCFQNVSECPIARGIAPTTQNRLDSTLPEPKFLFDTSRSQTHTPEFYSRIFDCKKRKAIRPVPTPCDDCVKARESEGRRRVQESLLVPSLPTGGGMAGRSESSGSSVALVGGAAGPSASSTSSSLNNTSGASTPRSFWKMARPSDMV